MVGNVAQLDRAANNNMGLVYLVCPLPLQPGMLQGCNGQTSLFVVGIGVKAAQLPLEQLEEGRYLHPQPMPFWVHRLTVGHSTVDAITGVRLSVDPPFCADIPKCPTGMVL